MSTTQVALRHGKAEVEPGVQLHYVEAGEGARTLVLVHGYPETWYGYRHVIPLFAAAGYRVIAVDYRGAGNSSKPAGGYDKHTMARDIAALLTGHLGVTRPVSIVGHDVGLTVAFAFATLFPELTGKLVLVDAIIPGTKVWHQLLTLGRLANFDLAHFFFHNARNHMAETLTAGRERVYLKDFFDRLAFNIAPFTAELLDEYELHYAAPGGMKAGFETYRTFDQDADDNAAWLAEHGRLTMPVQFVAGAESFLSTIADEWLPEIAADYRVARIPGSGHFPAEENPEAFAAAIIGFL